MNGRGEFVGAAELDGTYGAERETSSAFDGEAEADGT